MTYDETLHYLYTCAPLFQQVGAHAYKPGLQTTLLLDQHLGTPHQHYRVIHVGGTNGKGSCASNLASILQEAGYKVGLYTSPHLVDFRERIRVNGQPIEKQWVVDFVERERHFFEPLHPSFFEVTTALAFHYFEAQRVDVAVVEVGMGGRLDCTNIVHPIATIITNVSKDHTQFLGNTIPEIAGEKAGIIKPHVPTIIGEKHPESQPVFEATAKQADAPLTFAEDAIELHVVSADATGITYHTPQWGEFRSALSGSYQEKNTRTTLAALSAIMPHFDISAEHVRQGFAHVGRNTGLRGRWQLIGKAPLTIVDAAHNEGAWQYLGSEIAKTCQGTLHVVFGVCGDKDTSAILSLLPTKANYYFARASVARALPAEALKAKAEQYALEGNDYPSVAAAYEAATRQAKADDMIFVGGSCFVVADFLEYCETHQL